MLNIQENVKLSKYTTFKIGGPAKFFVEVRNEDEISDAVNYAKEKKLDVFVLAGGSNLLISEEGFDGLVIKNMSMKLKVDGNEIVCESGVHLFDLVLKSIEENLTGLEWAAGIPGTVGGAVVGNAGAFGGEMKDTLVEVKVLDIEEGEFKTFKNEECEFAYRNSFLKNNYGKFFLISAKFFLGAGDKKSSKKEIEEIIKKRQAKQPQNPSAGSFFKNPVVEDKETVRNFEKDTGIEARGDKLPVGWFIENVGLKGKSIGGAQVSEKHANFIINTGNATAEDVIMLSSLIKEKVRVNYGIQLQEEVRMVGF